MKVVIAAAGRGTRLGELTRHQPKHLIEVAGKPFLEHLLDNVKAAGYNDIIVVGGYHIEQIKDFLDEYDSNILLVNQHKYVTDGYGTACPVKSVKDYVDDEDFVFISGDNLFSVKDLEKFKDLDKNYCYLGGIEHEHPEKFGVLQTENSLLKNIIEKPEKFVGDLINASVYKLTKDIFFKIEEISLSPRGEYELTDAVNLLALEQKVKFVQLQDYWYDFGSLQGMKKIEQFLQS